MGTAALLRGVRILDLTGPDAQLCGRIIAELGAEVILVEPPDGVATRRLAPFRSGREGDPEASLAFAALNSGKRSVVIARERAREELLALARTCDAVVLSRESAWPDSLDVVELRESGIPSSRSRRSATSLPLQGARDRHDVSRHPLRHGDGDNRHALPLSRLADTSRAAGLPCGLGRVCAFGRVAPGTYDVTSRALARRHLVRAAAWMSFHQSHCSITNRRACARVPPRDGLVYIYVADLEGFLKAWQPQPASSMMPRGS